MKMLLATVKFKIVIDDVQKQRIIDTMNDYARLFDWSIDFCNQNKTVSRYQLTSPQVYAKAKAIVPGLPSALVQCAAKASCSAVKSFNSNHHKKKWQCKAICKGHSYDLNKLTLSIRGRLASICVKGGRVKTLVDIPQWFVDKYAINPNEVQSGKIKLNSDNDLILHLTYKIDEIPVNGIDIVGVDRGLYNLCTLSTGKIFSSKKAIAVKRRYQFLRRKLQQKGTRSAKRLLKKRAGREKRFMRDFNHCITKKLALSRNVKAYVLENLSGIRKQWKGRKLNSWLSNWSFHEFEFQLGYKCDRRGIEVVYVDPRYTSQKCSQCGNIEKSARKKSHYVCPKCGFSCHADVNAAINIRDNYVRSCNRNRAISTVQTAGLKNQSRPIPEACPRSR